MLSLVVCAIKCWIVFGVVSGSHLNDNAVQSSDSDLLNVTNASKWTSDNGRLYDEIEIESSVRAELSRQIGLPANPVGVLASRVPCHCDSGMCGCCTGFLLSAFRSKGCLNMTYIPEDFAFEVKMMMNDAVLYKNRMSGRNPRPVCVNPPRLQFIQVCFNFHDIYFVGRNMHFCLNMAAKFQSYTLFDRSFDCMRMGDQGVKIVKPGDDGFPSNPYGGSNADVDDDDDDDIEDYDENLIRLFNFK